MELGNLEMIMRLSRWHAIAPYSSLSTLEVSRGYVIYGIVLVFIYSYPFVFGIGREIYAIWFNSEKTSVGRAIAIGMNMLSLLIILLIIPRAPRRLTHIKHSIKKLNQINMKLNHKIGDGKRKYQYIIICCILIQFGIRLVDYFINANYYTMYFGDMYSQIWRYLQIGLIAYYNFKSITVFQISCYISTVLSTLIAINNGLENLRSKRRNECQFYNSITPKLAWSTYDNNSRNSDLNASRKVHDGDSFQREGKKIIFLQSLRELNIHYSTICDIVRDSMQLDGLLFCFYIINFFARFQINLFFVLFWKISTQLSLFDNTAIVLSIIWIFIHGKYLIIFVEPFHRTFNEMLRTIFLVNSLKAAVIDDERGKNEIETFQRILILNKPTFSPLNMFTINRSLILKIVGGVLTYVVTCLTYAPEMKRPTSFLNKYFFKNASTD